MSWIRMGSLGLGLGLWVVLGACNPPVPNPPPPPAETAILKRPSKSGAIAITGDDKYVVQINPENDSISIFRTSTEENIREFPVGKEPSAVVIHPDDKTAFVANREDGTVMKIAGINTDTPSLVGTVTVGSEPTGLALSPRGDKLAVAEFAEGRVSLWDTRTLREITSARIPNPRALAISNNGDQNDNDEKIVVTEFFGRPGPGPEASDNSRTGVVHILDMNLNESSTVLFEPVSPGNFVPTSTSPNQLASVAIAADKFYVTAIGASPDGVAKFNENVFPLVLVGKLNGTKLGVVSLADAIKAQTPAPRNFMADLIDLGLVGSDVFYFVGRGADAIQRAVFINTTTVTLGATVDNVFIPQINLIPNNDCQNPIGVVTPNDTSRLQKMFVNCWVSRKAAVVDLGKQKLVNTIASSAAPVGLEAQINRGRRFYFTGTGRWSNEVWSSCGSCHPDGLTDNITWRFGAGPRQSIDMSNTFSHGPGLPLQRILNWSAEREEISDFERNTRGVSGGVGAIVSSEVLDAASRLCLNPDPNQCDVNNQADPNKDFNGLKVQLGKPVQEIQDGIGSSPPSVKKDWDDITQFTKTIRPLKGRRFLDTGSVSRGRAIFSDPKLGNCATCHAGPLWTLSRLFFTPADPTNKDLANLDFTGPGHTKMIQAELTGQAGVAIAPAQVACVLRNLKTFGIPGDAAATDALEKKGVAGFPRAQGEFSGFNIPGLFGLQAGAPFLHHGQAKNLQELFGAPWNHQLAGNPVFTPSAQQLEDLTNFLLSIDGNTPPEDVPAGADKCPARFP